MLHYLHGWSNVAKLNEIILCVQRNNYFDSTNYLYIQRNDYLYIQQIIYIFNGIIIFIQPNNYSIYGQGNITLYGFKRKANEKLYVCPPTIPMATKLGRIVTCTGGNPPSKPC